MTYSDGCEVAFLRFGRGFKGVWEKPVIWNSKCVVGYGAFISEQSGRSREVLECRTGCREKMLEWRCAIGNGFIWTVGDCGSILRNLIESCYFEWNTVTCILPEYRNLNPAVYAYQTTPWGISIRQMDSKAFIITKHNVSVVFSNNKTIQPRQFLEFKLSKSTGTNNTFQTTIR